MKLNLRELAMDMTEEFSNTYFYAGRPNLTAGELFLMIFCKEVAEQLGIDDIGPRVFFLRISSALLSDGRYPSWAG